MGWWLPILVAGTLGVGAMVLQRWQQHRQLGATKSYRGRFVQLVAQLDTLTRGANQLGLFVRQVQAAPSHLAAAKALDYYEGTLRQLETLLQALRRIPPFGDDPTVLDSAFYLVRDCRKRIGRVQQSFNDVMKGHPVKAETLYGTPDLPLPAPIGCYFCSRPVTSGRSTRVKVRIDNEVKEVTSCRICRDELEATKKVKVLYFLRSGQPVHWSQVGDYQPSEDFWNLNSRDVLSKVRHLELVKYPVDESQPFRRD